MYKLKIVQTIDAIFLEKLENYSYTTRLMNYKYVDKLAKAYEILMYNNYY